VTRSVEVITQQQVRRIRDAPNQKLLDVRYTAEFSDVIS